MAEMFETARGTVHAWQCDHMGHINVRAYGEFFEEACWQLYNRIGLSPQLLRAGEINLAAVRQETSYLKELHPGDVISVRSAMLEVRERLVRFVHELSNDGSGERAAVSAFTVVCIDTQARRARALPPEVFARASALVMPYEMPRSR